MFKLAVIFAFVVVACNGLSPQTRYRERSTYYLYTRQNPQTPVTVTSDPNSINSSPYNVERQSVFLIHGHKGSVHSSLNPMITHAMLMAEDVNIIVVDWSVYASFSYPLASSFLPDVAQDLVSFVELLVAFDLLNMHETHFVGFDLGAHLAGIASRLLFNVHGMPMPARITGLDPSGNGWGFNSMRLKITDAPYVEIIHTDGQGVFSNGVGTPLGNVDFFVNGGGNQPGCLTNSCSHNRAYEVFAASMINPSLVGYHCSSNTQLNLNLCRGHALRMGTNALLKKGAGIYRINTKRRYPF